MPEDEERRDLDGERVADAVRHALRLVGPPDGTTETVTPLPLAAR